MSHPTAGDSQAARGAVHVFAGPTLTAEDALAVVPHAQVHPPVAHGDLLSLPTAPGDVVVIIDGYYHQRAPVRHKEVLQLIDRGVHVVGCASMGALRAAELAPCGMIGHGRVFEMYVDGEIDADDEVAVAHLPGDSFEARNVPLVNVRHAAAQAARAGELSADEADRLVAAARSLHYTERSWRNVFRSLPGQGSDDLEAALQAFLREHPEAADLKRTDALATLRDLVGIVAAAGPTAPLRHWQNPHVYRWLPEQAGHRDDEGELVSHAETLRHEQVHRPDFPSLWREFVLDEVSQEPPFQHLRSDAARLAQAVFARAAAVEWALSSDNDFLTAQEHAELTPADVLVRTLVRSYVPPRGLHDVVARLPEPVDAAQVRREIRAARTLNDQVLWRNRIRLVERLSTERLCRHLEQLWDAPAGDDAALLAAARDRGLPTLLDAVAAVRPYFLRDDRLAGGSAAGRWGAQ